MAEDEADLIEMRWAFESLWAATKKTRSPLHFIFDFRILCNLWLDDLFYELFSHKTQN